MPSTSRERPGAPPAPPPVQPLPAGGDILDWGVPTVNLKNKWKRIGLYGRNRIGKTVTACEGRKRICLLSIEPSPTGGALSVTETEGIVTYRIAAYPLPVVNPQTGEVVIGPNGLPKL